MKIGILKEEKIPLDSRVPLTPDQCNILIKKHPSIDIVVMTSDFRCFSDEMYMKAGVRVVNDLYDSTIKTLKQTQSGKDRKTPVIVRILGGNNIKLMLEYLSTYGNNSSLDKFVYKKFNDETKESAIYYIAVHDQTDFSTKN